MLKGNWVPVIVGWVIVCLAAVSVSNIMSLLLIAFDQVNADGELYKDAGVAAYLIILGSFMAYVLLSPLISGAVRLSANLAANQKTYVHEMFFYFKQPLIYFKTLCFNMIIALVYLLMSRLLDIYFYSTVLYSCELGDDGVELALAVILTAALIVSIVIKIFLYLTLVHYQVLAYALEPERGILGCTLLLFPFVFKNLGKAIKLVLSFAGWFALCFFVVPAMYTVPYFFTAAANETKWLLKAE